MRRLLWALPAILLAGCLTRSTRTRAEAATPVAVAFVTDEAHGVGIGPSPHQLIEEVFDALKERNLQPRLVPFSDLQKQFALNRDSRRRFELLTQSAPEPLALLVETQATYFSELSGRYRWTVDAKLTAGKKTAPAEAVSRQSSFPAILQFEHEKEPEAIISVDTLIARRAASMFDAFITLQEKAAKAQIADTEVKGYDSIYFVLVDRFANGDKTNDAQIDLADPAAFHGGDLQGVIDHLDDLQKLGVKTVWLSPIFRMRTEKFFGHGAYHGYWVENLNEIEPRFGTIATLRHLSDALHARGMKLYLDVVLNHVAFDSPLLKQHPDWFHHEGDLKDWNDPEQLVNRDVMGLPDLKQENPEVYQYLLDASLHWIAAARPDGFRLDAVKHIPLSFWARFNHDIRAREGPSFMMLGEDLEGDPKVLSKTARDGQFGAVFDFPLHFALVDVFCKDAPPVKLASILSEDRRYPDPNALVTMLDNHDLPRILTSCKGRKDKVEQALEFLLTARGVPSLTYGTEAGLTGTKEPENRGDMRFGSGYPLAPRIAQLLALRKSHPSLVNGATRFLDVGNDRLSYLRIAPDEAALILVNHGDGWLRASLPKDAPKIASATDAISGADVALDALRVWPNAVRVFLLKPAEANGFSDWAKAAEAEQRGKGPTREVVFIAPGEKAELVGSGAPFGDWDPAHGQALVEGHLRMNLPVGAVYEYKLVRENGGKSTWEEGGNRYLFVTPGEAPLQIVLAWGQRPK